MRYTATSSTFPYIGETYVGVLARNMHFKDQYTLCSNDNALVSNEQQSYD